jgi:hypothetical protein
MPDAATLALAALRFGPHGRLRRHLPSWMFPAAFNAFWTEPQPRRSSLEDRRAFFDDVRPCECGAQLTYVAVGGVWGKPLSGVLCPECDAEHLAELRALNEDLEDLEA